MRVHWWPLLLVLVSQWMSLPGAFGGEPHSILVRSKRADTQMTLSSTGEATTVDVTSPFGIDQVDFVRLGNGWPQKLVVRLRLKGLESFEAIAGRTTLVVSIPSGGAPVPRVALRKDDKEARLGQSSPYWTDVRIVGERKSIPLENGYFEIPLPAKLFEGNPRSIELRWVDFYRN